MKFDPPLDPKIAPYVEALLDAGIETFESCDGGPGHAFPEPTIRFHGHHDEGFRALAVALLKKMPVTSLRRVWRINDGEPTGPCWEFTFVFPPDASAEPKAPVRLRSPLGTTATTSSSKTVVVPLVLLDPPEEINARRRRRRRP